MTVNYDKENRKLQKLRVEIERLGADKFKIEQERDRLNSILAGMLHETRRLNLEINSFSEELSKCLASGDMVGVRENAESIMFASGLISSRLTFSDFELNPVSLARQGKIRAGIYKKFDKSRRLLAKSWRSKGISVRLEGLSYAEIDAVPAFELVPFVLLDNAIKYSPDNQDVKVLFEDRPNIDCHTRVTISSVGPMVSPEEIEKLTERGYRGGFAHGSRIAGEGLGLYLAEILSATANAKLKIFSSAENLYSFNGIPYSAFWVELDFFKK
ncbi:histidine kinase family protein [Lysobacter enzymogenes]|uniref:histidine kinase n=1 Tax=Lysobacter enzymogenes TaxID=69 RepID=A0A0S2DMN6_LYSEN|nr:ATP-binding protein [Lysobacter enzymogenes]ALN59840.1 histidine kinase family protein [Lysobacter enzymogenes]QCW27911.1 sensor histidine kinase [Lysobacter enzymogenes]